MTSTEARDQLMAQTVDEAKRHAMAQVREIEQRAREDGEERARKIVTIAIQRVASEQTAESTVSVFALPSEDMKGRIIGREGRQHPRVRGHDRREPDHRRHARGRGAVVLRPGAARGRADDPREARRGRPDPPRAHRGDPRAVAQRAGRAGSPSRRERRRRGRSDRHPPRAREAARAPPVPDVVRPERAQAPGGVGAHRLGARLGAGARPGHRQARRVPARHRQGRHARDRGVARHHRRRDRPAAEGVAGGRALHRVAPRRGRATIGRRRARADRRPHLRGPSRRPARVAGDLRAPAGAPRGDLHRAARRRRSSRCRRAARSASW